MRIGIVHTASSKTCGCAPAIERGVEALGWASTTVDCEDMMRDPGLLKDCDVVFDHTDTVRGGGRLRPFIRFMLEAHGYCTVGADAKTCLLCDHKMHARDTMMSAGIPVPNGFVYRGGVVDRSSDIQFPVIAKCGYEHMSRALRMIERRADLERTCKEMYKEVQQPIIVEEKVGIREVEVCIIPDEKGGYRVLPFMEWIPSEGQGAVFTYARKQIGGSACRCADLPCNVADRLQKLALTAFHALNIRDYCRFDVRIGEEGVVYFLEANVIPNMEEEQGMARAALEEGIEYSALIHRLIESALERKK